MSAPTNSALFENKIVGYGVKKASEFKFNPLNYRRHPQKQRAAIQASLRTLGWIDAVKENIITGNLIDGHDRVAEALATDADVPYLQVELSIAQEALAIATYHAIAEGAQVDPDKLEALLAQVETDEPALLELLADFSAEHGLFEDHPAPAEGAGAGVGAVSFFDRVIHRPKLNKKRTGRFLSLCAWNSRTKQDDVKFLHAAKAGGDYALFLAPLANEVVTAIDELCGRAAIAWVTTPPRSHVSDHHLATDAAIAIAGLLGVPFVRVFADTPRTSKSHPVNHKDHKAPTIAAALPAGLGLLFDDVATTGTTLEYCAAALKRERPVLPLAWLYEDALPEES